MTLVEVTLLAVAIASILISIVLIVVLVSFWQIYKRVQTILNQFEVMAHTGLETSRLVRDQVEHVSTSLSTVAKQFITLRGATEIVGYIGDAIKNARHSNKAKESNNGSESK